MSDIKIIDISQQAAEEEKETDKAAEELETRDRKKEMRDALDEAILAVSQGGQSYQLGSRKLTRAQLPDLLKARSEIAAEIAAESSTGLFDNCYTAIFDGR